MEYSTAAAVVPGYYLVCYNLRSSIVSPLFAVVPGYYLVCYNYVKFCKGEAVAVVPGYYLVCYNASRKHGCGISL